MKRVYTFGDGKAEGNASMRNLLGGKGANLAEMNLLGMPLRASPLPPKYVPNILSMVATKWSRTLPKK